VINGKTRRLQYDVTEKTKYIYITPDVRELI